MGAAAKADKKRLVELEKELRDAHAQDVKAYEAARAAGTTAEAPSPLNLEFRIFMMRRLFSGARSMRRTRFFARTGGWVLLVLWSLMGLVGLAAIAFGVYETLRNDGLPTADGLIATGAGGVDLLALAFFKPTESIKRLLADMVQLEMAVNGFQTRVSLELLAFKRADAATVLAASQNIGKISQEHLKAIETYYQNADTSRGGRRVAARATQEIGAVKDTVDGLTGQLSGVTGKVDALQANLAARLDEVSKRLPL